MFERFERLFRSKEPKRGAERSLRPVSAMVCVLNREPIGTKIEFDIDFGPGIRTEKVIAYFDHDLFLKTRGHSTVLKIEGLPEELHKYISS